MKYKWKDKVRIKSKKELECISEVTDDMLKNGGAIMTIACLVEDADGYIMKEDGDFHFLWSDEMIEGLVEEETYDFLKTDISDPTKLDVALDRTVILPEGKVPDGYILKDENGNVINATKIVLEKKKKEYPKTYEECCKVMNYCCNPVATKTTHKEELIRKFQFLLLYRDAYWKIAGEEMELGKPWEPDWENKEEEKYTIEYFTGRVFKGRSSSWSRPFAFPTEEMRDAFKENFDTDLEICKELL